MAIATINPATGKWSRHSNRYRMRQIEVKLQEGCGYVF